MPYKMTVYFRGMPKAISELRAVKRYLTRDAGKEITIGAFNAAGDIFSQNFDTEGRSAGTGGWPQLAQSTQDEREALGFGRAHPILIRYGDLKYATATLLENARGSTVYMSTDAQGNDIAVSLNIGKKGGVARAFGDKAVNQIDRPFWTTKQPVTRAVRRKAVEVLDHGVEGLF